MQFTFIEKKMTVYNISNLPKGDNNYFIDTNVLLNLHGLNGNISKEEDYSTLIEIIIENNQNVVMDVVTLSEFVNRYAKSLLQEQSVTDFKKENLRRNPVYPKILKMVGEAIKEIKNTYKIQFCCDGYDFLKELHTINIEEILTKVDFNDYAVYHLCKVHNCILVTHDADFSIYKSDIDILTANRKM